MQQAKSYVFTRNVMKYLKYNAYFTKCDRSSRSLYGCHVSVPKYVNSEVPPLVSCVKVQIIKVFSTLPTTESVLDSVTFERVCEETLQSLSDYFEELLEESENLKLGDVSYGSGVLTINLGEKYGTYVINRQSPNKQIWLSSPTSGPKRYDFNPNGKCWIYKHNGESLHTLLQREMTSIVNLPIDFSKCSYSKL